MAEIDLTMGPGFTPCHDKLLHLQLGRSFLCGPHADDSIIQLRWYSRDEDNAVVGRVWFGPGAQGPPGHAHGGSSAAVMDEALGSACWVAGYGVLAAELTTKFLKMVPLDAVYTAEAWVDRVDGRKIYVRGHIIDDAGSVYTTADGLFIALPPEKFQALASD